jgi:hypothetical protein
MRSLLVMAIPYQHALEVSIVRTDTCFRRVNADSQIDFLGRSWPIAPTQRLNITLIHHPLRQFWAVTQPPLLPQNTWPEILGNYSL